MRNFQYHLFNPYAVNEEGLQEIFGFFEEKPKEPPLTLAQRRQRALKLNYPDEGQESLYGPDGPISPKIIEEQKKKSRKRTKNTKISCRSKCNNTPI